MSCQSWCPHHELPILVPPTMSWKWSVPNAHHRHRKYSFFMFLTSTWFVQVLSKGKYTSNLTDWFTVQLVNGQLLTSCKHKSFNYLLKCEQFKLVSSNKNCLLFFPSSMRPPTKMLGVSGLGPFDWVIKRTKIPAEIKRMQSNVKTRHRKQTHTTKNIK